MALLVSRRGPRHPVENHRTGRTRTRRKERDGEVGEAQETLRDRRSGRDAPTT